MRKAIRHLPFCFVLLCLHACGGNDFSLGGAKKTQPKPSQAVQIIEVPVPEYDCSAPFEGRLLGGMQEPGGDEKLTAEELQKQQGEQQQHPEAATAGGQDPDTKQGAATSISQEVRRAFAEALQARDLNKLLLKLHAMRQKSGAANYQSLLAHLKEGEAKMVLLFEKMQQALGQIVSQQGLETQLTDLIEELHEKGQDNNDNAHQEVLKRFAQVIATANVQAVAAAQSRAALKSELLAAIKAVYEEFQKQKEEPRFDFEIESNFL